MGMRASVEEPQVLGESVAANVAVPAVVVSVVKAREATGSRLQIETNSIAFLDFHQMGV